MVSNAKTPKNPKKSVDTPREPVEVEEVHAPESHAKRASCNTDSAFWGLLLVTVGGLLLVDNLDIVHVDWMNVWRLWPLAIIATGLSLLSRRSWLWRSASFVFIVGSLAAVVFIGTGGFVPIQLGGVEHSQQVQREKGVERADVTLDAGASKLVIGAHERDAIVDAAITGDTFGLKDTSSREGGTQFVRLRAERREGWFSLRQTPWDVTFTNSLPLKVRIEAGASSVDADFSRTKLEDLTLESGASAVRLVLGEKMTRQKVRIDSGASSVTVRVPKHSGIKLEIDGGITSKDVANLTKVDDEKYQSDNYGSARNKIDIEADLGLASFTLERY